jgi:hypothetical protein
MGFANILTYRWLGIPYTPRPEERPFLGRVAEQRDNELVIRAAVLDHSESERFFGVPLARRGIQPVWLQIRNEGGDAFRLRLGSIDPGYFPPLEAALLNHYHIGRRILGFGLLGLCFHLLLLVLLPLKIFAVGAANRRMNAFFEAQGIGWGLLRPGTEIAGFVFTTLDEGTKQFSVRLVGTTGAKDFAFAIPVPGLRVDYGRKELEVLAFSGDVIECDGAELKKRLAALPRSTSNRKGTVEGDPLNLVAVGEFATILHGFGARWDETETITLKSCWRTGQAFLRGSRYRYSPVSPLYVDGRSQDFALQKARQTINQRLHLRLWMTPLRHEGKPVWIGQVSRDIGVRFTPRTWNLTTHRIDPDVDDARDYVLDDLMESGRVARVGYVAGVEAAERTAPRRNLTGDPYFTDGLRAVAIFTDTRTNPTFLNWM